MAIRIKRIDVTELPDTLRLAEEVERTHEPQLLERHGQELAVISPISSSPDPSRAEVEVPSADQSNDWLLNLIGIADAEGSAESPTDVSANKHKYVADALVPKRTSTDPQ